MFKHLVFLQNFNALYHLFLLALKYVKTSNTVFFKRRTMVVLWSDFGRISQVFKLFTNSSSEVENILTQSLENIILSPHARCMRWHWHRCDNSSSLWLKLQFRNSGYQFFVYFIGKYYTVIMYICVLCKAEKE
jgi:hypothetical protein